MKLKKFLFGIVMILSLMMITVQPYAQTKVISIMRPGLEDAGKDYLDLFIKEYKVKHPDVEIKIVNTDWGGFQTRLPIWVRAGSEPDIYLTSVMQWGLLKSEKAILPLDDIIDKELKKAIPEVILNWFKINNKLYGYPGQIGAFNWWYNKEIFEKAGLDPNKPPKNWNELKEYAKIIKEKTGVHPIGLNLGRPADVTHCLVGALYYSAANAPFVDAKSKARFNSLEGIAVANFLRELYEEGLTQPSPETTSKGDLCLLFRDGKVAMAFETAVIQKLLREVTDIRTKESSKFGIAPPIASSFKGKKALVAGNVDPWVVSAHTKYPQIAKDILSKLLQAKWAFTDVLVSGNAPFRQDILQYDLPIDIMPKWVVEQSYNNISDAIMFSQTMQTPPGLEDITIKQILTEALQKVVIYNAPTEKTLNEAATEIEKTLKEAEARAVATR